MLVSLHVKNFAIINEIEVIFKDHLNIMTGETGAGKSIIIGSINAAIGAKASKNILRSGADYALVELVFETSDPEVIKAMQEADLSMDDNRIIISRKIMPNRTICKINGENVTTTIIASIAGMLIDIHGQHEHQSLLHKDKHLEIVDRFAKEEVAVIKDKLLHSYNRYSSLKREYESVVIDEDKRAREISFLEYEVNEIKNARLIPGEDEELAILYKKLSNINTISEGLKNAYDFTGYDNNAAGDFIGRAIKQLIKLSEYDDAISGLLTQAYDVEGLLNDLNRDLSEYLSGMDNQEEDLNEVTKRLDLINHFKKKYGSTLEQISHYCTESEEKLNKFINYYAYVDKLRLSLEEEEKLLKELSLNLSDIRRKNAKELTSKISEALISLNFLDVKFDMVFEKQTNYSSNGIDDAEFIISTNPGETMKPLSKVASGGELSRIMLGIKSVLADKDEIETLIFDEIDVGISGRTAQKVSEQLSIIAKDHQIICITHLAQIAAMADAHFIIEKKTDGITTQTDIHELNQKETIDELARILGGAVITDRVMDSAQEMKELASSSKKYKF